jgi:hypothetical protein
MARGEPTLARFGLPNTELMRRDLAAAGLWTAGDGAAGEGTTDGAAANGAAADGVGANRPVIAGAGADRPVTAGAGAAGTAADAGGHVELTTLARVGRPELAARLLARLVAALDAGPDGSAALRHALRDDAAFRLRLLALLGASETLGDHLVTHPDAWRRLAAPEPFAALTAPHRLERLLRAAARVAKPPSTAQIMAALRT